MGTKLVVINGLSASGKSTLAAHLSKGSHLPLYSKDDFKELLGDSTGFLDYEHARKFGKVSYEILFLIAERCLRMGISLIIEGNFTLGKETQDFIHSVNKWGIDSYEIHCFAGGQILVDRFLSRKRHPVHRSIDDDAFQAYAESLRAEKLPPLGLQKYMEVDTSDPKMIDYKKILDFIQGKT